MIRGIPALFILTVSAVLVAALLLLFSTNSIAASEQQNDNNKKKLSFLKDLIEKKKTSSSSQKILRASRPTSTVPFVPRSSLNVLQRDLDNFAIGETCVAIDIPTRRMWGWGPGLSGYCGETSFQSSLILYGSWISAERVRYADGDEELLIGVNDEKAAKNLDLDYEVYDEFRATGQNYLDKFVKPKIEAGNPVILGFYELQASGDKEYDHIMIIRGIEKDSSDKVVGIYYNDFWSQEVRYIGKYLKSGEANPRFISTRKKCQTSDAIAQPYDYCIPSSYQYSISLTGLDVANSAGIYTRVTDYLWFEPDWGKEDGLHQTPVQTPFTLVVNGNLKKGSQYMVMRFDSSSAIVDGADPLHSSYTWTYNFTHTGDDNTESVLTNVTSLMSDGEYYWVTVPRP